MSRWVRACKAKSTLKRCRPTSEHAPRRGRSTTTSPDTLPARNGPHRRKRRFAHRLWLALAAAPIRFFKGRLKLHIALRWDGRRLQALETEVFEEDPVEKYYRLFAGRESKGLACRDSRDINWRWVCHPATIIPYHCLLAMRSLLPMQTSCGWDSDR